MSSLLVVAGEASGDRAAAAVIARLPGVDSFGLGLPGARPSGILPGHEQVAEVVRARDLRERRQTQDRLVHAGVDGDMNIFR